MGKQDGQERLLILRSLLFLRMGLLGPFFLLVGAEQDLWPSLAAPVVLLLLALAVLPVAVYFLQRRALAHPAAPVVLAVGDFAGISLVNFLIASQCRGTPLLFPLYFIVAVEASCWWGWTGALVSAAASGVVLSWLFSDLYAGPYSGLAMITLTLGWPVALGYFAQWILQQWRERRRIAAWLARQEDLLGQVRGRIQSWQEVWQEMQRAGTSQELFRVTLERALAGTSSCLGLIARQDPHSGEVRAECWRGLALFHPGQTSLRCGERVAGPAGEVIRVGSVLEASLAGSGSGAAELGHLFVARTSEEPYGEEEERYLRVLASAAATILENRFLQGQLGRLRDEADSIALAGWTLSSLPDPAAALEMACRNVLSALDLKQVVIFLYGRGQQNGCRVIVYPAREPARTMDVSLQGKGPRLLRRLLASGTSLVLNRRSECPELFDLMEWEDAQAVACFPLFVLQHCWGLLCLLAGTPGAFPPHTQQNLAIFSGEVAMALENFYLRRAAVEAVS